MHTVAIASPKGGTGKTTTAVNLAAVLAGEMGRPTLLIDLDPQGGALAHLDLQFRKDAQTLIEILDGRTWASSVCSTAIDELDVAPSSPKLASLEAAGRIPATRLRVRLREIPAGRYLHVLVDCPPGLRHLVVVALAAADLVLVPVECRPLAYLGVSEVLEFVDTVRAHWNPELSRHRVWILPTRFDRRTKISEKVVAALELEHARHLLSPIPENVALSYASAARVPVTVSAPSSPGAKAYRQLARRFAEGL